MEKTEMKVIEAFKPFVRVNADTNTVEVVNDYGTAMVLRNLDAETLEAFKQLFRVW